MRPRRHQLAPWSLRPPFTAPPARGVGCSVLPSRLEVLDGVRDLLDVVEVSPDALAHEVPASDGTLRLQLMPDLVDPVLEAIGDLPVIVHGLELSIGSAASWNEEAVRVLNEFSRRVDFAWHSEHLGFLSAGGIEPWGGHAGIPLPLPFTETAVNLVAVRADDLSRRTGRTFLLENAACYLPDLPHEPGWDEATFLSELCARSGCGLLLDLFNLYVNCVNFDLDVWDLLERVPLDRVVELHVAGGDQEQGFLLDSHSQVVPEPVWDLVDWVLDRAPNVAALVFEVLGESFDNLGHHAYRAQVLRARAAWDRARPPDHVGPLTAVGPARGGAR